MAADAPPPPGDRPSPEDRPPARDRPPPDDRSPGDRPPATSAAPPPSDSSDGLFGLPTWAVWAGGVVLLFLVAFGIGWVAGAGPIEDLETRLGTAETRAAETEARVERLESELAGQEALALLYRAMLDVDQRNFGIANERLSSVAATLGRVSPELLGMEPEAFYELRDDVAAMDVEVAADLAGQRAALSDLARRLASMLGVS